MSRATSTVSALGANGKPNRPHQWRAVRAWGARTRYRAWQGLALLAAAVTLTSCANWHGIANVPMPGGPGSGPGSYTVYVQMPDTLALNDNSRVRVADVFVGTVRAIELKNWVASLTLRLDKGI
ncbi:MlaD family protein, partial [Mycobacterium sp.]|uniref:MlaD family protein n=1 Tax=Mycobacterium sp. TaxID=1785 RepID=UPI003F9C58E1